MDLAVADWVYDDVLADFGEKFNGFIMFDFCCLERSAEFDVFV